MNDSSTNNIELAKLKIFYLVKYGENQSEDMHKLLDILKLIITELVEQRVR